MSHPRAHNSLVLGLEQGYGFFLSQIIFNNLLQIQKVHVMAAPVTPSLGNFHKAGRVITGPWRNAAAISIVFIVYQERCVPGTVSVLYIKVSCRL